MSLAILTASALEAVQRCHRAKGLLLGDDHVGRHIGQHGRFEEAAALRGALAAGDHIGPFLDRVGDVRLDLLDRLHVDQGPITAPGSNPSATCDLRAPLPLESCCLGGPGRRIVSTCDASDWDNPINAAPAGGNPVR